MVSIALLLSALASAGAVWVFWRLRELRERLDTAPPPPERVTEERAAILARLDGFDQAHEKLASHLDAVIDRVNEHDGRFGELTLAVDEGIKHVDRSERRVRSTVRRALNRMEDAGYIDEAVEAEAAGIREIDAAERGEEAVQPVPQGVEGNGQVDFSDLPGEWP